MNKFRLLTADEIECRIGQISEKGLSLLLYKTARTDANILDETVGPENWECEFKEIAGVLYGGISIYDQQMDRWVEKWDCGIESYMDADKGRASDAFKRAGFKWGIGRELYSAPFIWIGKENCTIEKSEKGKLYCNDRFRVVEIEYSAKPVEISRLVIANDKRGVDVFTFPKKYAIKYGESKNTEDPIIEDPIIKPAVKQPQEGPDGYFYCEECGEAISNAKVGGKIYMPKEIAERALRKHDKQLCWACQKKHEMPTA